MNKIDNMLNNIIGKKKVNIFPQKIITNVVGGYKPQIQPNLYGRNISGDRGKNMAYPYKNYLGTYKEMGFMHKNMKNEAPYPVQGKIIENEENSNKIQAIIDDEDNEILWEAQAPKSKQGYNQLLNKLNNQIDKRIEKKKFYSQKEYNKNTSD